MMMKTSAAVAAMLALGALALPAATWYVDAAGGRDDASGARPSEARRTLAGAMAIPALADDDVIILLPGVYDDGEMSYGEEGLKNRAVVSKNITIRSLLGRATRDETVIEGVRGATDAESVRGIAAAADVVLEGLTFRDCWALTEGNDVTASRGGAANVYGQRSLAAVDCRFVNCGARSGGALSSGKDKSLGTAEAVRCRFDRCSATYGSAVRDTSCYFCLVTGVTGGGAVHGTAAFQVVNCTFYDVDKMACSMNTATAFLNCADIQATGNVLSDATVATNCVFTVPPKAKCVNCADKSAWNTFFMAPQAGDFRPRSGGSVATAGRAALLDGIPAAYRATDYAGEAVETAGDAVAAGCLTHVVAAVGGRISFQSSADFVVNGEDVFGSWAYFYTDDPDREFRFQVKGTPGAWLCVTNQKGVASYPDRDGTYALRVPASATAIDYVLPVAVAQRLTVAADGSGDYATIQEAVDAAPDCSFIAVRPGVYAAGGSGLGTPGASRVELPSGKNLALVSTDGAAATTIVGAAAAAPSGDTEAVRSMGLGEGAVRCLSVLGPNAIVDGFTLCDGHTAWTDDDEEKGSPYCGGGVYATGLGALIRNCVITNCAAVRGGGAYCGTYRDCTIVGCAASYLSSVATQDWKAAGKLDLVNCLFDDCWGSWRAVYNYNAIRGCTFGPNIHSGQKTTYGVILGNSGYAPVDSLFLGQGQMEVALAPVNCAAVSSLTWKEGSDTSELATIGADDWDAATLGLVGRADAGNPAAGKGIGALGEEWTSAVTQACKLKSETLTFDLSEAEVVSNPAGVRIAGGRVVTDVYAGRPRRIPVNVCGNGKVVIRANGAVVAVGDGSSSVSMLLERGNAYSLTYYPAVAETMSGYVLDGSTSEAGLMLRFR